MTLRPARFLLESQHFLEWLKHHLEGPVFWQDTSKKNSSGLTAPETHTLVYGMTSRAGLSEADAWNKSPGQAATIIAAVAELEGAPIHFCDPDELAPLDPMPVLSREEVYRQALKDLGPARAAVFMERYDNDPARRN